MFQNIQLFITNHKIVLSLKAWAQRTTLPGFQGVKLYNVISFLYSEVIMNPLMMTRANAIAFSFFMSLFPAFMVLFSLIPFAVDFLPISLKDITKLIEETIDQIMPNKIGEDVSTFINSFLKKKRTDFLSIGFVLAIFFSSNGLMALMKSFEKDYAVFRRRPHLEKRLSAIGMTLMLGILLIITTLLVILGNQIFSWLFKFLKIGKAAAFAILLIKWFIVLFSVYVGIALIYRFGIASRRRLHFFSPGASTAAILSLLSSIAFSFYVDNFGNYNKVYGSFVGGIVLLLWLQLNAIILIFGFELNAAIAVNRDLSLKKIEEEKKNAEEAV